MTGGRFTCLFWLMKVSPRYNRKDPITQHMVSTLPSSPPRKPGNLSAVGVPRLGRRRREDIKAIRVEYRGPKSTRRNTIELNRSCIYRTGLVEGWISTGSLYCVAARRGTGSPCTLPPKTAMCIFYFFLFSCENFVL